MIPTGYESDVLTMSQEVDMNKNDCPYAEMRENDRNGKCLGFQRSICDDEPIDICKECIDCTSYESEEDDSDVNKKTIHEWEKSFGIRIIDPDGFDRKAEKLYVRNFSRE